MIAENPLPGGERSGQGVKELMDMALGSKSALGRHGLPEKLD